MKPRQIIKIKEHKNDIMLFGSSPVHHYGLASKLQQLGPSPMVINVDWASQAHQNKKHLNFFFSKMKISTSNLLVEGTYQLLLNHAHFFLQHEGSDLLVVELLANYAHLDNQKHMLP